MITMAKSAIILFLVALVGLGATLRLRTQAESVMLQNSTMQYNSMLHVAQECGWKEKLTFEKYFGQRPSSGLNADLSYFDKSLPSGKMALFLFPDADSTKAFAIDSFVCWRVLQWLQDETINRVELQHVSTVRQAINVVESLNPQDLGHLVVAGHGTPALLEFGEELVVGAIGSLKNSGPLLSQRFWRSVERALAPGVSVFLQSCSNAGRYGLSEEDSNHLEYVGQQLPGHKVYGGRVKFSNRDMHIESVGADYDLLLHRGGENIMKVANCQSEEWESQAGLSCEEFASKSLCLEHRNEVGKNGKTALQACCECGGGEIAAARHFCPAGSEPDKEDGSYCVCSEGGKKFLASDRHVECPAKCERGSFDEGDGWCGCDVDKSELCYRNGKFCNDDISSRSRFLKECTDCYCKALYWDFDEKSCEDDVCTCPLGSVCLVGDREGQCPFKGGISALQHDENCDGCVCRGQCPSGSKPYGGEYSDFLPSPVLSSLHEGHCNCADGRICVDGKDNKCSRQREYGPSDTSFLWYACPDCTCGSPPLEVGEGACTYDGAHCQLEWEYEGTKCTAETGGCCKIDGDHLHGCPTTSTDKSIGEPFIGGYRYDWCDPSKWKGWEVCESHSDDEEGS